MLYLAIQEIRDLKTRIEKLENPADGNQKKNQDGNKWEIQKDPAYKYPQS